MNKFGALLKNELIKISKKKSILVILIIMTAVAILMSAVIKIESSIDIDSFSNYSDADELEYYESLPDSEKTPEILALIEMYRDAVKLDINMNEMDYLANALRKRCDIKSGYISLDEPSLNNLISLYEKAINDRSYREFIAAENKYNEYLISNDKELEIHNYANELLLECNPEGSYIPEIEALASDYITNSYIAYMLDGNLHTNGEIEEAKDKALINEYRLKNRVYGEAETANNVSGAICSFGMFLIAILAIILSGSSISQEIATGSIKSLIIAPVRRGKIFFSKLLAIVIVSLISLLWLYLIDILLTLIFFDNGSAFLFVSGGNVIELVYPVFLVLSMLVMFVKVLIYVFLGIMLSSLTRNTAISVGVSMAVFFCSSLIGTIATLFMNDEMLAFLPSNNIDLSGRLFGGMSESVFGTTAMSDKPIVFSVVYIVILSVCLIWIARDSFVRRDV